MSSKRRKRKRSAVPVDPPAAPNRPRPRRSLRAVLARNREGLRAWLAFVVVFLGLVALLLRWGGLIQETSINWTATATAWILDLLGADGRADGAIVTSSLFTVRIIFECTAVFPLMIFVSAVVAYPSRIRQKLVGLGLGVPALLLLNEVRLVSLIYVGHWFPQVFETMHVVFWQSLMIFFTLVLWLIWASRLGETRAARPA